MKVILAAIACVAAIASASYAAAATFTLQWSGTVSSGIDTAGLFGTPGTDLAGEVFSSTFTFDTALGTTVPGFHYLLEGGPNYGSVSSPGSATLTIGGRTFLLPGSEASGFYEGRCCSSPQLEEVDGVVNDGSQVDGLEIYLAQLPFGMLPSLVGEDYVGNPCAVGLCTGVFWYGSGQVYASFTPDHLSISSTADMPQIFIPVPEPATWATMIVGMFGLGAMLRRRSAAGPVTASC